MTHVSPANIPICFRYLASVSPYSAANRNYIKVFAIEPDVVNANRWGVTQEALASALRNLVGKPLLGPPELAHESPRQVGRFVGYTWNGALYGIAEITDPYAWERIRSGEWRYVSPQVKGTAVRTAEGAEIIQDFTWEHVAFTDSPAYGVKARVYATCEGVDSPEYCSFSASLSRVFGDIRLVEERTAQKYPWEECVRDRLRDGYTEEQARRICAAIKNRTVTRGAELGLWSTLEEGVRYIAKKASEDPLYAYTLDRLALVPEAYFDGETSQSPIRDLDRGIANLAARLGNPSEVRESTSTQQGANMTEPCAEKTSQLEAELKTVKAENQTLKSKVAAIEEAKHLAAVHDTVDLRVAAGLLDERDRGAEIERLKRFNAEALAAMRADLNAIIKRAEAFTAPKAKYTADRSKTLEDEVRMQLFGTTKHLWEK